LPKRMVELVVNWVGDVHASGGSLYQC
jgi:hypothetical protein